MYFRFHIRNSIINIACTKATKETVIPLNSRSQFPLLLSRTDEIYIIVYIYLNIRIPGSAFSDWVLVVTYPRNKMSWSYSVLNLFGNTLADFLGGVGPIPTVSFSVPIFKFPIMSVFASPISFPRFHHLCLKMSSK